MLQSQLFVFSFRIITIIQSQLATSIYSEAFIAHQIIDRSTDDTSYIAQHEYIILDLDSAAKTLATWGVIKCGCWG